MSAVLKRQVGFTIVELLIVIVVIAILAAISVAAYTGIQSRARDAIRKSDLSQIAKSLQLYYAKNGDWIESGSGCGYGGNGTGWFNYVGGSGGDYTASISSCLTGGSYMKTDIKDPTGGVISTPASGFSYMKDHCGSGTDKRVYVYAKLESIPQSTTATDGTCGPSYDSNYGMNYYVQVN